ncbi:serine hydrolase domain-containing protein [Hyphobacterium sp.]|uniref:serine hydrolase domain-containing protein n=1 Tax=Hyphobacterium sp. TaxID=2004662 RepID=UPI003B52D017
MTILRWIGVIIAVIIIGGLVWLNTSPIGRIYLPAATGITAKQVCSLTFVSGLEPDRARALYVDPLLGGAAGLVSARVDRADTSVHSRVLGLWHQEAVFREGHGCTLNHGRIDSFDPALTAPPQPAFEPFELDTTHRDANFDTTALQAAVDDAFDPADADPNRNTLAVAVFHQGRLVAERYAPGVTRDSRLHGWSMTKSMIATLAGVMVEDGEIELYAPDQIDALSEWRPELSDITLDNLLRMSYGLAAAELNNGFDPNTDMLMTESDMPRFAATREQLHEPGAHWQYMSANTILATHALQTRLGDTLNAQTQALRDRLFHPLGIYSAVLEPDESGTWQGSSYLYMTPHDWARLGMLYLDDGMANGERLIPADWYEYISTPTPGSGGEYGAGFWLPLAAAGLPENAVMMSGFQGQWGYIMPDQELMVVRFGATNRTNSRSGSLAAGVLEALQPAPAETTGPEGD